MAKTVQVIIEDETYKTLIRITEMDKRSMSQWCKLAIEKEVGNRKSNRKMK